MGIVWVKGPSIGGSLKIPLIETTKPRCSIYGLFTYMKGETLPHEQREMYLAILCDLFGMAK